MISQMTPAGESPAMRARSTAASVCPALARTPALRARNGNTCPGRTRSEGLVAGSIAASTVAARSAAEIPVVVRSFASMLTQKAVSNLELFCRTISGNLEFIEPLGRHRQADQSATVQRAMKLMASGVIFSAAMVRSPFVLTIFIVYNDHHLSCAYRCNGVLDAREGTRVGSTPNNLKLLTHMCAPSSWDLCWQSDA
jgi:hypothetical protein